MHDKTETAVANEALSLLRQPAITDLLGPDHSAKVMRKHFAAVRDGLLRRYPWNFAEKYATLQAQPDKAPAFRYKYAYALPTDCLAARDLYRVQRQHWKVQGRSILSNTGPSINLIYTRNDTDVAEWDALFRMAFSTALAARCAPEIAKDLELESKKEQQAEAALQAAFPVDAGEGTPDEMPECDVILARY